MRTLEQTSSMIDWSRISWKHVLSRFDTHSSNKGHLVRRQHLFVIALDYASTPINIMSNPLCERSNISDIPNISDIYYITSWSSKGFISTQGSSKGMIIREYDGNHPNWIPNTNKISMNIESSFFEKSRINTSCKWTLAVFDLEKEKYNLNRSQIKQFVGWKPVVSCSSGHPNFHINSRYVIIDAYSKESEWFKTRDNVDNIDDKTSITPGYVPLRLVDTYTSKEVTLLEMKVNRDDNMAKSRSGDIWRCDMHPTWSRDFKYLVFNGRVNGGNRQVLVSYLGDTKDIEALMNTS